MKKSLYIIIVIAFTLSLFGQNSNEKLKISHLKGDFYIFTTYNLYKGVPVPANGLYLVSDSGVVMIDTPWDTTQFQPLLDSIERRHRKKVVLCIATHSHEDRTAGLEFMKQKGVKTFTSKQTDSICKTTKAKRPEFYFTKDSTFKTGQYSYQAFYPGEGHTKDNIVIWFEKEKILYGGCLIKSVEAIDLGYVAESNLKAWPATLKTLQQKFKKPDFIIPGHGEWKNAKSLEHTLNLLKHKKK
ncbi:MAG: BlaB/IND/MUS family subclass B1 metallo-beta-lactamase [Bacteroidia bacterium]|nr:BlaB/IND/MUS family subclass B1 metallo-beta-lactamase [Bacteroidia bacterium]